MGCRLWADTPPVAPEPVFLDESLAIASEALLGLRPSPRLRSSTKTNCTRRHFR